MYVHNCSWLLKRPQRLFISIHIKTLFSSSSLARAMQDHHIAILKERLEYHLRNKIIFAELDTGRKIIGCPTCHVPFKPHLGNWIADKFPCKSCKADLSFRDSTAKTARCPCCNISRPVPNDLTMLVCGGCQAKVYHQKCDKAVKCSDCKHINIPTVGRTYGVRPPNQVPPQVNRVVPPQVNRGVPPQVNHVVPPQVHQVVTPQVNQVPRQVNRVLPPRVYHRRNGAATAETESTATSSFSPKPEIIVLDDDSVAEAVRRNVATKRVVEVEGDKTEAAGSKKIRF